ncbi:MAG: basic helix-loop-helix domain-containing protein [Acidimicrobiales bacterium]
MGSAEENAVIDQLRAHRDRLRAVMDLVGDRLPLPKDAKERAQTLMQAAKESLRADYKRMSTVSGEAALNPTEDAYLRPAVHEAFTHLRVKWNSNPSSEWHSDLYEAVTDIEFFLHQLEPSSSEKA